jgi:hypothetical protein
VRGILEACGYSIPAFGDDVGLRRLHRAAVGGVQQANLPAADERAWIAELTRHHRPAVKVVTRSSNSAGLVM